MISPTPVCFSVFNQGKISHVDDDNLLVSTGGGQNGSPFIFIHMLSIAGRSSTPNRGGGFHTPQSFHDSSPILGEQPRHNAPGVLWWRSVQFVQNIQHVDVMFLPHYYVLFLCISVIFPPFHRRKDAMTLLLITAQHQLGTSLVVELRGDVKALGLGSRIARVMTDGTVTNNHLSEHQPKFRPMHFLPCRLHIWLRERIILPAEISARLSCIKVPVPYDLGRSCPFCILVRPESKFGLSYFHPCRFHLTDGFLYMIMLFTCQLGNNAVDSEYFSHCLNA